MFDARALKEHGKSKARGSTEMVLDYAESIQGKNQVGGAKMTPRISCLISRKKQNLKSQREEGVPTQPIEDAQTSRRSNRSEFEETRLDKPENQMPRLEDAYTKDPLEVDEGFNKGTDANQDAIAAWR